jgi:hypothetical protein
MRKKELRYFRRLEGVGRDGTNITTTSPARDTQSITTFPIREDVEEVTSHACMHKLINNYSTNMDSFFTDNRVTVVIIYRTVMNVVFY